MKKLLFLIICIFVFFNSPNYSQLNLDKVDEITSFDINNEIIQLKKDFPNFVEIETLGQSVMGKKIKVIRISTNINRFNKNIKYDPNKKNTFYIAGLHAKEVIAPVTFLNIIRKDLAKVSNGDIERLEMLTNNVIHFIPLINPDGFDLAKFGKKHSIFGANFNKQLKSNANGVDLNNNFPDKFYDVEINKWNSIKNKATKESIFKSTKPSVAYYWGTEVQNETKIIIDYMDRFYFEFFIDIHSQGNYVFWDRWFLSDEYRKENLIFAKYIQKVSSNNNAFKEYHIQEFQSDDEPHGYGYSTAYYSGKYGNPAITLETALSRNLPYTSNEEYFDIIDRFSNIFLEMDKYENKIFPHRVYKNGQIYGDYIHKSTAKAIAQDINGYYKYELGPIKTISEQNLYEQFKFLYSTIITNANLFFKKILLN